MTPRRNRQWRDVWCGGISDAAERGTRPGPGLVGRIVATVSSQGRKHQWRSFILQGCKLNKGGTADMLHCGDCQLTGPYAVSSQGRTLKEVGRSRAGRSRLIGRPYQGCKLNKVGELITV